MKAFVATLAAAALMASGAAAKSKSKPKSDPLSKALAAVVTTTQSSGPPAKTADKDQGDDHANPGAILIVCSKDTPAARRSAICPISVSPQ